MPEDSTRLYDIVKIIDKWMERMFKSPRPIRLTLGVCGLIMSYVLYEPEGPVETVVWAVAIVLIGVGGYTLYEYIRDAWVARPAYRFNAMADRAERLAGKFAQCASWADRQRARPVVREMAKLRDDLAPLEVYIPVESSLYDHPAPVIEACRANENTLRRLAELMSAGDLATARVENPKTPAS